MRQSEYDFCEYDKECPFGAKWPFEQGSIHVVDDEFRSHQATLMT